MMYSEFLVGTGAPESNPQTYEQFKAIEKVYMLSDSMTKPEAYKLWKQTFGREIKAEIAKVKAQAQLVLSEVDTYEMSIEAQRICLDRLARIKKAKMCGIGYWEEFQYTDKAGYQWTVKTDRNPNGTYILSLCCTPPKKKPVDVHYGIHEYDVPSLREAA
jgi:hypothetical protein